MITEPNSTQCSVQVVVRLQPPENSDIQMINFQTLSCANKLYLFDYIFPNCTTQDQVYDKIGMKMIASAKKGYNCCIFAYGQTGSGKTYTMTGTDGEDGLIQKCLKGLVKMLQGFESFELKVSYFQIYNEQVNDLLASNNGKRNKEKMNIKIKESLTLGFYLENLQQVKVEGIGDMIEQLEKGLKNRTTAQTKMNRQSSRSHSILTLFINTRHKRQNGEGFSIKSSKMHFVDLAGSEKQKSTMAAGDRLKEASSINKSLTSLSIVIEKLSSKATHIPYRDSVLTKILRDSLGGNSRTILIATLSSKQQSISETISTLNFATKAKKVKLSVRINEQYDGSLIEMRRQIKQLESQIKQLRNKEIENKCASCQILKNQYQILSSKFSEIQNQLKQKQSKLQKYAELMQKLQKQHEYELAELMQKIEQTSISHKDKNCLSKILTDLQIENEERYEQCKELINVDQQYDNENCDFFVNNNRFDAGLSVIMEQNTQQQITQIGMFDSQLSSRPTQQRNGKIREGRKNMRGNKYFNKTLNSSSLGSTFEITQAKIINELRQKNSVLESELNICKIELQHNIRQNEKKLEENKRIYEPIIKQWIQNNGSILKQSLKAKNAIEQDLIFGLRAKIEILKQTIQSNQQKWAKKEAEYRNTIEKIMRMQKQFQSLSQNKGDRIQIEDMPTERRSNEQHLSKSHPRMSNHKNSPHEVEHATQNNQNLNKSSNCYQPQNKSIVLNNCTSQSPLETIQKLQQELDRQQLIKEELTRQLQNYKLKAEQLEGEIEQNRELVKFWQNKCNNQIQAKKEIQRDLYEANLEKSSLLSEIERKIKIEQAIKIESSTNQEQLIQQMKQRQNEYVTKIQKLESTIEENKSAGRKLQDKITSLEESVSFLKNQTYNNSVQIQNYRKNVESWKNNYERLEQQKRQVDEKSQKMKAQLDRLRENYDYTVQKYERQKKLMEKEHAQLQKENSNQFIQLHDFRDQSKLLGMKYRQLKEINDRLKAEKEQLSLKNKDLYEFIEKDQSQSCRDIQRLNENNAQLEQKLQRCEQKQNYLIMQFNSQREQTKYWRAEYEKQKKWAQDFKKMQDQFLLNQQRERSRQKNAQINKKQNDKKKRGKDKDEPGINSLASWQYSELKRQVCDIADKLSEICGINVGETNLVLKLDEIAEKINSFKMIKEENKSLKVKNKLLSQQRNSEFWNKID